VLHQELAGRLDDARVDGVALLPGRDRVPATRADREEEGQVGDDVSSEVLNGSLRQWFLPFVVRVRHWHLGLQLFPTAPPRLVGPAATPPAVVPDPPPVVLGEV
jgi:hypothetical protein